MNQNGPMTKSLVIPKLKAGARRNRHIATVCELVSGAGPKTFDDLALELLRPAARSILDNRCRELQRGQPGVLKGFLDRTE